ncbi:phage minor tail protein L [Escherichia coli]|nr:phage minor tail protein L [Escherichia coli]
MAGNPEADPEQELTDRWVVEQMSSLTAMTASFVLATPTETDGALFPGRIMLANTCMWTYRSDASVVTRAGLADEFDKPTTDIRKDRCKCKYVRVWRCAAWLLHSFRKGFLLH